MGIWLVDTQHTPHHRHPKLFFFSSLAHLTKHANHAHRHIHRRWWKRTGRLQSSCSIENMNNWLRSSPPGWRAPRPCPKLHSARRNRELLPNQMRTTHQRVLQCSLSCLIKTRRETLTQWPRLLLWARYRTVILLSRKVAARGFRTLCPVHLTTVSGSERVRVCGSTKRRSLTKCKRKNKIQTRARNSRLTPPIQDWHRQSYRVVTRTSKRHGANRSPNAPRCPSASVTKRLKCHCWQCRALRCYFFGRARATRIPPRSGARRQDALKQAAARVWTYPDARPLRRSAPCRRALRIYVWGAQIRLFAECFSFVKQSATTPKKAPFPDWLEFKLHIMWFCGVFACFSTVLRHPAKRANHGCENSRTSESVPKSDVWQKIAICILSSYITCGEQDLGYPSPPRAQKNYIHKLIWCISVVSPCYCVWTNLCLSHTRVQNIPTYTCARTQAHTHICISLREIKRKKKRDNVHKMYFEKSFRPLFQMGARRQRASTCSCCAPSDYLRATRGKMGGWLQYQGYPLPLSAPKNYMHTFTWCISVVSPCYCVWMKISHTHWRGKHITHTCVCAQAHTHTCISAARVLL